MLICYDKNVSWKTVDGHDAGLDDAVIATTQMMLEAYDLGIGSVWVRGYDKRVLDELFELPENLVSVALLPIGYPSEKSKPSPLHSRNISMDEMVKYLWVLTNLSKTTPKNHHWIFFINNNNLQLKNKSNIPIFDFNPKNKIKNIENKKISWKN